MTAIGQVKSALMQAIAAAGCAAVGAYDTERLKRYDTAVAAVGARGARITTAGMADYLGQRRDEKTQTLREVYGRNVEIRTTVDVFAPRLLGADGCETAAEQVTQALSEALPEGLRLRELRWEQTQWDRASGMFRRSGEADYAALFVAETEEDETVFTDCVLKGTVKEHEQHDP